MCALSRYIDNVFYLGPEGDLTTFLNGLPPESGSIREHIRINLPATFQKTDPALDPLFKDNIENQKVLWLVISLLRYSFIFMLT